MPVFPRGLVVPGPRCSGPRDYGLLASIPPVTPSPTQWEGSGVEWEDTLCGAGVVSFLDFCPPVTGYTKDADRDLNFCHSDAFFVKGSYQCSPVGRPVAEAFEIARQRLLTWESHEVERVLWTGTTDNGTVNPSFAEGNDTCDIAVTDLSPVTGAFGPVGAIATLEEALTDVTQCGVIHVPYGFAAFLASENLLIPGTDGNLYTPTGHLIIVGAGYPGSGPGGVIPTPGTTYIYATGPVSVWQSNVFMTPNNIDEAVDRNINNITVHAERAYAVGFSCAVFATLVSIEG